MAGVESIIEVTMKKKLKSYGQVYGGNLILSAWSERRRWREEDKGWKQKRRV